LVSLQLPIGRIERPVLRPYACAGNGESQQAPPRIDARDDGSLMRRVVVGDLLAFRAIYDRHAAAAHGLAYRMLRERAAAEDVVQEAFIALWRGRHDYRPERGSLRSWLLTITRNRAIDAIRRTCRDTRTEFVADRDREALERTDEEAMLHLEAVGIGIALQSLPDAQRQAVELSYFGGLSQREIADRLGIPLGTVKGRLRLALNKLAAQLDASAAHA
jgi:RNA polymerase sigma-70 factor, ECF subfamily